MITWADMVKANESIETMEISRRVKNAKGEWVVKANRYAQVKDRVMAFRSVYPEGTITTNITITEKFIFAEANCYDDTRLLATGHAREPINKDFAYESAETSAVGRCLGFAGFGITTSIASAEEMERTESPSGLFDEPIIDKKDLANEFRSLFDMKKQAEILNGWGVTNVEDLDVEILKKYVSKKKKDNQDKDFY